MGLTVWHLDPI